MRPRPGLPALKGRYAPIAFSYNAIVHAERKASLVLRGAAQAIVHGLPGRAFGRPLDPQSARLAVELMKRRVKPRRVARRLVGQFDPEITPRRLLGRPTAPHD